MPIERRVSLNDNGVVYQQENDRFFVNGREVWGIEADMVQRKLVTAHSGVREHVAKIHEQVDRLRDYVRTLWR